MVRSTMPSAQGRAEAGAAVVAIGVGSPAIEAQLHVSAQMGGGGGKRGPQSAQSEP